MKNLTVILVARSLRGLAFHALAIPYVRYPDFSRDEAISIVVRKGPPSSSSRSLSNSAAKWYGHFVTAIYDTLIGPTTRSLPLLVETCERLWPSFILPHLNGERPPGRSKAWDFSKLLVRNRAMIQIETEQALNAHLIGNNGQVRQAEIGNDFAEDNGNGRLSSRRNATNPFGVVRGLGDSTTLKLPEPLLLRFFSALVLVAAYLASHTPPKLDILLFSRLSSSSRKVKKSYHRRKLFQSPTKQGGAAPTSNSTAMANSVAVLHKNVVRSFSLDRLVSIVRAIHPRGVPRRRHLADKVESELAELVRLRLVDSAVGDWGADERLAVNVSKVWVEDVAHRCDIDWKDFQM